MGPTILWGRLLLPTRYVPSYEHPAGWGPCIALSIIGHPRILEKRAGWRGPSRPILQEQVKLVSRMMGNYLSRFGEDSAVG